MENQIQVFLTYEGLKFSVVAPHSQAALALERAVDMLALAVGVEVSNQVDLNLDENKVEISMGGNIPGEKFLEHICNLFKETLEENGTAMSSIIEQVGKMVQDGKAGSL